MTDERQGLPVINSGRFHFDQAHDPSVVPSTDDLKRWACAMAKTEGSGMAKAVALVRRIDGARNLLGDLVTRLVPFLARRSMAKADARSIAAATHELERLRELMREFGVDLTRREDHADTVEAIAAMAIIDMTQQRTLEVLDGSEDNEDENVLLLRDLVAQTDTRGRLERYHARMRSALENEAVINLMLDDDLRRDASRRMAALKSARDEVTGDEMRDGIDKAIERTGG